jgi:acyl-CoA hydrolase
MTNRNALAKLGIETDRGGSRPARRPKKTREDLSNKPAPPAPSSAPVRQSINELTAMAMDRLGGLPKTFENRGWKRIATVVVFAVTPYHYGFHIYTLGDQRRSRFFFEAC